MLAKPRVAALDNVGRLNRTGAIDVEDFGDRFGHERAPLAQRAGPATASALAYKASFQPLLKRPPGSINPDERSPPACYRLQ